MRVGALEDRGWLIRWAEGKVERKAGLPLAHLTLRKPPGQVRCSRPDALRTVPLPSVLPQAAGPAPDTEASQS